MVKWAQVGDRETPCRVARTYSLPVIPVREGTRVVWPTEIYIIYLYVLHMIFYEICIILYSKVCFEDHRLGPNLVSIWEHLRRLLSDHHLGFERTLL